MKYILLLLLTACASVELAPMNIRQKTYNIETKLKKDAAFDRLQSWVASGGGTVRINDRSSGIIGMRANTPCDALRLGSGFAQDQRLWYYLELKAEDMKVTATFNDLKAEAIDGAYDTGARPSNAAEVESAARECLEPLVNSMKGKL